MKKAEEFNQLYKLIPINSLSVAEAKVSLKSIADSLLSSNQKSHKYALEFYAYLCTFTDKAGVEDAADMLFDIMCCIDEGRL